ncbi:alpha/beta hydrolase [Halobacteriales archaeon Cl-PHB]
MGDRLRLPGPRERPATLDGPEDADTVVVAAPPHPQMGGSRTDGRLRAVSGALADHNVACLRFDYGPWDEGRAEQTDVAAALDWAGDRFQTVGAFGYSFGAGVTLLAVAARDQPPVALSVLAPPSDIVEEGDVADAVDGVDCPAQVVYGERDSTVDWAPVVDRAVDTGWAVTAIAADHHFVGQQAKVADAVADFFASRLDP